MSRSSWPPRCASRGTRGRVVPAAELRFDVADLIARHDPELRRLEALFKLEPGDPLAGLLAWRPEDEVDQMIKSYLFRFAQQVIHNHEQARRSLQTRRSR